MKNTTFRKGLVVGIVLLFVGVASGSCITTPINSSSSTTKSIIPVQMDLIEVTCGVSTITGVREIKKELRIEDAKRLLQLMNESRKALKILRSSDSLIDEINEANQILDTSISHLKKFDLLPTTMSLEEARDLITGAYGERIYDKYLKRLKMKTITIHDQARFNLKMNIASTVAGHDIPIGIFPLSISFAALVAFLNFMILPEFNYNLLTFIGIRPRILIPIGIIHLYPMFQGWTDPPAFLETSGMLGYWCIEDRYRISLFTIGFVGIYGFLGLFGFAPFIIAR